VKKPAAGRVLVFGGAGFIGSHVADTLSARGYDVSIFDRRESPWLGKSQKMIIGDITDLAAVVKACEGMDYVYNFAGLADINQAKDRPLDTAEMNIIGNIHVLEGARAAKAKRFVFASSVYVYSEAGSFYRASKQASERFVELYWERFKLPYTILRYGSLYGRRSDERNIIFQFIRSALERREIHYPGTGEELREYIHTEDAAQASVDILVPEYENQHIVLTGHQALRVRDIMVLIAEMLGKDVKLSFDKLNYDAHYCVTPYAYKPRIGKKLVTNPFVDIGQGIIDCMHEIDERLGAKR